MSLFQRRLSHLYTLVMYHYGNVFFSGQKPALPTAGSPTDADLAKFETWLKTQPSIPFTDANSRTEQGIHPRRTAL